MVFQFWQIQKKALIVGEYAKEQGKGNEYVHAIWKAYMVDGKNISLIPEIENAAQTVGISAQEVKNALEDSRYAESLQKKYGSRMELWIEQRTYIYH